MESAEYQKAIGKMVTQFVAAVQNTGIYPDDHPQVLFYLRETHRLLEELLESERELTVLLIGESLMANKRSLITAGAFETAFAQIVRSHSIERMTFTRGLPFAELGEFIRDLSLTGGLTVHSTRHIKTGKLEMKDRDEQDEQQDDFPDQETDAIHDIQMQTMEEKIRNIYDDTLGGRKINMERADEIVRHFMDEMHKESNPLQILVETKSNDEYTFTHTANVGILTLYLAERFGFEGSTLSRIGAAAILHDVGKVTTPNEILSKPGPLTDDERAVMETHSLKGALNLMEQANITNIAVLTAMEHHMKYDGTGYPRIKEKWEPHIVSQMVSVADVYDALRTVRPYRPQPMPMDRIIKILRGGSGTAFNPTVVERFLNLVDN